MDEDEFFTVEKRFAQGPYHRWTRVGPWRRSRADAVYAMECLGQLTDVPLRVVQQVVILQSKGS